MRLSQTKEATKEFVTLLESHLTGIHLAYRRNPKVKGIRHEYFRQIEDGLFAIHSVICIKGHYYHCFCLSLHQTHTAPSLYSPFTIGGRCDHNYTITRACHQDLGLSPVDPVSPFRMSDSHGFRTGADRIIRRCTSEAEARLLPAYLAMWTRVRPVLRGLIEYYSATPPNQLETAALGYSGPRHELSCHMLEFQRLYSSLPASKVPGFYAATIVTLSDIVRDIASSPHL